MVTICTTRFTIKKFHVPLTQCIYVFCVDLRTNSDYFPTQCELMEKRRQETGKDTERYIFIITGVNRKKIYCSESFWSVPVRPSHKGRLNTKHWEMKKVPFCRITDWLFLPKCSVYCAICNEPLNTILSTVSTNTTQRTQITLNMAAIISRG